MKNLLVCAKCKKEFITLEETSKHQKKTNHHEYDLKERFK
jgi:hypothetical protein